MDKNETQKLREVKILDILGVRATGKRVSVRCPFHSERTPSCVIYPDNSFHCFSCQAHGAGAIDFVTKMGFTFTEACEELKKYT